jgi:DNA-binding PadR family transcriptional regulator
MGTTSWSGSGQRPTGALKIDDGALYTSLHRMEQRGWLDHEGRVSPRGRRAKYYRLTRVGRDRLRAGERGWRQFATTMARVFAARQRA